MFLNQALMGKLLDMGPSLSGNAQSAVRGKFTNVLTEIFRKGIFSER